MRHVVVLSGAGISAESGLKTFRDSDGLWEGHRVEDVATPEAWQRNPEFVQKFYNERREAVLAAKPNAAHLALAELEKSCRVSIVTQNIDDLHERAGSTEVLHLHGEILKSQSSLEPELVYAIDGARLKMGEYCELGSQLRPHVVWFGEAVPMLEPAAGIVGESDVLLIVGTSLAVYPAAGLVHYAPRQCRKILVDPKADSLRVPGVEAISEPASTGVPRAIDLIGVKRG